MHYEIIDFERMKEFIKVDVSTIDRNFIKAISQDWMLITAGDSERFNTMTASWGFVGEMWGKHCAIAMIRPQRYTATFTELKERMTLSFLGEEYREALQFCGTKSGRDTDKFAATGLTPVFTESGTPAVGEATLVLECRKLYCQQLDKGSFIDKECDVKWYPKEDYHLMYILEIEAAYLKQ